MSLFKRRPRPVLEPSYAEEESNPELLAAEKAVNALPSIPSGDSVFGVMFGQRPHIVDAPGEPMDDVTPADPADGADDTDDTDDGGSGR